MNKARLSDPHGVRAFNGNADLNVLNNSEYESKYNNSGGAHLRSFANTQQTRYEHINEQDKGMVGTNYLNSPEGVGETQMIPGLQILVAPSGDGRKFQKRGSEQAYLS